MNIRPLTEADISAAQRLREQAGWNQTDDDWRRLLAWSPDGCWAAELDGHVVGTTAVITYGRRIAWIGMVLVDEARRRQGIGRSLLTHAVEHLDRLGVQTIALDSTPEGQPLYARLGFEDAFELARWRGPIPTVTPAEGTAQSHSDVIRPLAPADLAAVAAYDARRFGTDRAHLLGALYAGHPQRCFVAERHEQIAGAGPVVGYVLSRPGARAWHLGPLAADDLATAEGLVRRALLPGAAGESWGGAASVAAPSEMVMDVVMPNPDAVTLATSLGLTAVRRFIRMTRGTPPPSVDAGRLYTSAGPELG
jgi:predicted N-acetyltransferase YhbS